MIEDIQELKALVVAKLDVSDLLDILGMEVADLVDFLEEQIEENAPEIRRACR